MEQQPYSFMLGDLWDQALAYNNLPTGSPCRFGACSYSNSCKIFTISDFWAKCMFSSHVTPKSLKLEAYSQSKAMTVSSLTLWGLCFLLSLPRHSHFPFSLASNSSLVQFSHSVMSDSLLHHKLQHARPPCPSPTPGVYPNPCPLSQWCHPTILSSVIPFSCPQSFPPSGSFPMSQLFTSRGQSIGISASTSDFQWTPRTDLL